MQKNVQKIEIYIIIKISEKTTKGNVTFIFQKILLLFNF